MFINGEVAEWFKAVVLKTIIRSDTYQEFESLLLRQNKIYYISLIIHSSLSMYNGIYLD